MVNSEAELQAIKQNFSETKILIVGDVMLDRYYFSDVKRISPEAPVPIAHVQRVEDRSGGAANVSRNIAYLGAKVTLLTIAGQDEILHSLEQLLQKDKVQLKAVTSLQIKTTMKLRIVSKNHQLLRVDFEENIADRKDLQQQLLEQFKAIVPEYNLVIFSDYDKGVLANVEIMLAICRQNGITTLVDPKGNNYRKYCNASIITPNLSELRLAVSGFHDDVEMRFKVKSLIKDLNLSYLLLTKSEKGMELFSLTSSSVETSSVETEKDLVSYQFPAYAKTVYDVSGAGDTVIAILGLLLAKGTEIKTAIAVANIAAGVVVSKFGTATVSVNEIIEAIEVSSDNMREFTVIK